MSETPTTRSEAKRGHPGALRLWVSPRRKRFWAALLLLAYTVFGFFGAPPLLRHLVVTSIAEQTGRESELDEVRVNPFLGTVDARGFRLFDTDGAALARFDRLFVDFEFTGLFRWAWTFRLIHLQGFDGLVERYAAGDTRLSRLLADVDQRTATPTETDEDDRLPRLLVQELRIEDGAVTLHDRVPVEPVELRFGPVTASVEQLNTLPDRDGRQSVEVTMPDGSKLRWQGDLRLGPLHSEGRVEVEGAELALTIAYLKSLLPLTDLEANLSVRTGYHVSERPDGAFEMALEELEAELADVSVTGLDPQAEFLAFDRLAVSGGRLELPARTLSLDAVRLNNPRLLVHRNERAALSLEQLAAAMDSGGTDTEAAAEETPWRIEVDRLEVDGGRAEWRDAGVEPAAVLRLEDLGFALQQVSNAEGRRMPLTAAGAFDGGGRWEFDGNLVALPEIEGAGTLRVDALSLPLFQPYVAQRAELTLASGALSGLFELALPASGAPSVAGAITVSELAVQDTLRQQPLVGWERMDLDRFEADLSEGRLELSRIDLLRPYGRLTLFEDQTTNLAGLVKETPQDDAGAASSPPGEPVAPPLAFVLGAVAVREGALDFADRSLPLPFATEIRQLNGTVSTLDSRSSEPATVRFEGQVDEYGLARIDGSLNPLNPVQRTQIRMEFRNLLMSSLSPYSVDFAGREIAEGKLDLDLLYRIEGGMMQGQNKVVMSDLVLGEEVDAPGAASLPLGLAVALLKDADGVIDIELPVEGDVNDPEFRIGGVVWQALVGLVTRVVTAPFRLLGSLVGADSEDLGAFQFLPGRSDLTPPEREKVGLLQQALEKRPELSVEIPGVFVTELDRPALQFFRLREQVLGLLAARSQLDREDFRMLDDELRGALETVYRERFPDSPLQDVKDRHRASEEDIRDGAPEFDELAYAGDLRDQLLESEAIGPADLHALAEARAEAIRTALAEAGVSPERLAFAEPAEAESEDGEWIPMELGVAVD